MFIISNCRDITERRQIEESVRESEARFRLLFQENQALLNGIPDGLTLLSPDLKILWANSFAAEISGMEPAAMVGRHCYEVRRGLTVPCGRCPVMTTFATGEPDQLTVHFDKRSFELRSVPVKDENGKVIKVIEIGRDITEQKNLQNQLQHSQKMEAVGQLAGGVAHDFNNVLTAIIGFASLIQIKMEAGHQLRHYAGQIIMAAEKAAGLTQSLLAFSKKQILDPHPLELNQAITNVQKMLRRLLREDIELVTNLCPETITVMADRIHFEQVLMNLVSNARDAMPNGGAIFIGTEVHAIDEEFASMHGYGKPGKYACISVSDTGVGMDQQTREKVFDPYFTTKEPGKGTGLGLASVYGIVKQHDGYINVYSESGNGTSFKIYLPLLTQSEREKGKTASPFPKGGIETILLVEDAECVRESNRELLENFGYGVIEAIDGEDAIDKFALHKDRIDLMILDVIMPKKGGKEVYESIKEIRADILVLFTSGYTADIITHQGILDEKLPFIAKPIAPRELLKKIREVLGNH
jgi:PAS domain S-box-containing protein